MNPALNHLDRQPQAQALQHVIQSRGKSPGAIAAASPAFNEAAPSLADALASPLDDQNSHLAVQLSRSPEQMNGEESPRGPPTDDDHCAILLQGHPSLADVVIH